MATIIKRNKKYSVVYNYKDELGETHQKWETFDTKTEANKRKVQVEFEQSKGTFIIPTALANQVVYF